jgi:hypothetical protein
VDSHRLARLALGVVGFASCLLLVAGCSRGAAAFPEKHRPLDEIDGIWIARSEIRSLPMTGAAWRAMLAQAKASTRSPDLSNQEDPTNVRVLAKALVFVRTGEEKYRRDVVAACIKAIGTERGGRTLSLARELAAYVIAADLVHLDPEDDERFREWLRSALSRQLKGRTLRSTQEHRPNNWGTHAAASRIAVALYLRDSDELQQAARVFKGYLGDREAWDGFRFGDLAWQADPRRPVGVNPAGATRQGHDIDGVLPDDQRRCCRDFVWPPPKENYVYEGLQGALAAAVMLDRAGYDVWEWQDRALLRAFRWLHAVAEFPAVGDDTWQPHLINHYYGTDFPVELPSRAGKNVGFTGWTHGADRTRREAPGGVER